MSRKKRQNEKNKREQIIPPYTLICEGQTEQYYFQHLNKFKKTTVVIKNNNCKKNTKTSDIEYKIKEVLANHGRVLCVFDADVEEIKLFLEKLRSKYNKDDILICDSMPSIEYWFLLHYDEKYGSMTADNALRALQEHIKNYDKTVKFLRQEKWVEDMLPHLNDACQRARNNIDGASYSNVYKIFEQQ